MKKLPREISISYITFEMTNLKVLLFTCFILCNIFVNVNCSRRVLVALKQNNIEELQEYLLTELSNPLSKNYGNYLTVEDLANRIGASDTAIEQTMNYLKSIQAYDISIIPTRDYIEFSITGDFVEEYIPESLDEYVEFFAELSNDDQSETSSTFFTHSQEGFLDVRHFNHKKPLVFSNFGESTGHLNIWIVPTEIDVSGISITLNEIHTNEKYSNTFARDEIQCTTCESLEILPYHSMFNRNNFCSSLGKKQQVCFIDNIHVPSYFHINNNIDIHQSVWQVSATFQTIDGRNSVEGSDDNTFKLLAKEWDPNSQKEVYELGTQLVASSHATQMVWGTGTYGYSSSFVFFFLIVMLF